LTGLPKVDCSNQDMELYPPGCLMGPPNTASSRSKQPSYQRCITRRISRSPRHSWHERVHVREVEWSSPRYLLNAPEAYKNLSKSAHTLSFSSSSFIQHLQSSLVSSLFLLGAGRTSLSILIVSSLRLHFSYISQDAILNSHPTCGVRCHKCSCPWSHHLSTRCQWC
jgi:hypothetical protein